MTIQELKSIIESGNIPKGLVILKSDSEFLLNQYVESIIKQRNISANFVEKWIYIINGSQDIFSIKSDDNSIDIYNTEEFDCNDERLKNCGNVFVTCKKITKQSKEIFKDYIIEVDKLEKWQIEDYASSLAEGVNSNQLKNLVTICNYNIYRLDNELQKIKIFPKDQQQIIFNNFLDDNIFCDLNNHTIFDFSNAILRRDINKLFELYKDIRYVDVEPLGLVTILIKNFKNVIDIQLSRGLTAEQLGMKPNQYWAIKNNVCGFYTKDQLMNIYRFLNDIDRKIKIGEMPMEHLVDYVILKVVGV